MTRMFYFLIIVGFLAGCNINEPRLPKWDTSWEVHLKGDAIKISEVLDGSSSIKDSVDSNGENTFFISVTDTSEVRRITSHDLAISGTRKSFSNTLGAFEINQPAPKNIPGLSFGEIFIAMNPQPGVDFPPVPPAEIAPAPTDVVFEEFVEIEVADALMTLVFHNNLILDIEPGMEIVLIDKNKTTEFNGGVIDTFKFDSAIPANTIIESNEADFSGKNISNELQLVYRIPLSGTDSVMTLSQEDIDSDFFTEVVMSDIKVDRALAKIPEQSIIRANTAPVDADDHAIQSAEIASGEIHLLVGNNLNIASNVRIELPNFTDSNNDVLSNTQFVAALSQKNITIDLAGYTMQHELQNGQQVEELIYNVIATTVNSDEYVWMNSEDSVTVDMVTDSLYFNALQGTLNATEITFEQIDQKDFFNFDNVDGSFVLPELALTFNFHSDIDFDISVDMKIKGFHRDKSSNVITDSVTLNMTHTLDRSGQTECCTVVLDKQSSNPSIVDLMAIMPNEITVTGKGIVQGDGSIDTQDEVWVDYIIESPLTIQIDAPIVYNGKKQILSDSDLDEKKREDIAQNFTEASFIIVTENHWPIGTAFKFYASSDSSNLFNDEIVDSTDKFILQSIIQPAQVGSDGYTNKAAIDEHSLLLTPTQIALFEQSPLYYGFKVEVSETDEAVRFRSSDQLHYQTVLNFDVTVDPDN